MKESTLEILKTNFETAKTKYNSLNFLLNDMHRQVVKELREAGNKHVEFSAGTCYGTMCKSLRFVYIKGMHFDEHGVAILDCLSTDNTETTCAMSDMRFNTDEKYNLLSELMKHV